MTKARPVRIGPSRHHFRNGGISDRCTERVWSKRDGCQMQCGLKESNVIHRFYPCRRDDDCYFHGMSIENRDQHEANEHGGGW